MRRLLTITALAAVAAVVMPASASAKTLPAATWAPKFCVAISTFQDHLTSDGTRADSVLSGDISSIADAKSALVDFMTKATRDADAAVSALRRAGVPDTTNGPKIAARFVAGFQTVRGLYASARTDAQHLATTTLSRFESGTKKLTAALSKGGKSLEASFASIQLLDSSGKLGVALRAEPTCAFLKNSSQTA